MLKKTSSSTLTVMVAMAMTPVWGQVPPLPEAPIPDAQNKPRLVVPQRLVEVGKVIAGTKVPIEWVLFNKGGGDLVIERTIAGCGCTVVHLSEEEKTIRPGESRILRAEFNSYGRMGDQKKTVTVVSNDPYEPNLKVQFHATVDVLYHMRPPGRLNLRAVRRGQTASETLDITPALNRGEFELLDVRIRSQRMLTYQAEPLVVHKQTGQRLHFTVTRDAPLGRLSTEAMIRFRVGKIEQEVSVKIFGEVVADLAARPSLVKPAARPKRPGNRLAPVHITSTNGETFEIIDVKSDPVLETAVEAKKGVPPGTGYKINLTIADGATPGPFAAMIEVETSSAEQPLIRIPVFGVIAPPIAVEPPVVVLRSDGGAMGRSRRLRLEAAPRVRLEVSSSGDGHAALEVHVEPVDDSAPLYVRYVNVSLRDGVGEAIAMLPRDDRGRARTTVVLSTNVEGAERLVLPVLIEATGKH